jgi:hypothetical protein
MILIVFSAVGSESERILGMNALLFGVLLIVAGFIAHVPVALMAKTRQVATPAESSD